MFFRFAGFGALLAFSAAATTAALAIGNIAGCAASNATTSAGSTVPDDASADAGGGSTPEAGNASDAGSDGARDGATVDAASGNVDGPGTSGATCSFNRDCHLALRCECDETTGCACKPGVRGTGKNGIDPCASGNDCASSVCVEGPPDSGSFCSDECMTSKDCTGVLPLCSDIAFVGRICIRTAPP